MGQNIPTLHDLFKERIQNLLVVFDDIAIPLNKIRLRPGGSDAGHNGLKSIQEVLATNEYPKLRFGIGNNFPKGMQSGFVLGKWSNEEEPIVKKKIDLCVEVIETFATAGINTAMNNYNNVEITL